MVKPKMKQIQKIVESGLCLGCGLCESIATSQKCKMILDNETGFYVPVFKKELTQDETKSILRCCPGIIINGYKESSVWGKLIQIDEGWSTNTYVRQKASSGGVISELAIHLITRREVDGILHVGADDDFFLHNSLKISRTKDQVIKNIASRYAPALIFNEVKNILNETNENYAFIGKPCDIAGLKNFLNEFNEFKGRIKYFIAIFCAGMPSYNGTKKLLEFANHNDVPTSIKYRGDGWPGFFEAKFKNREPLKISYRKSWGEVLGKQLELRCKICPDGIGLLADISVGDSWNTKDGYPDFEESMGRSFVIVRTPKGDKLYNDAKSHKKIENRSFDLRHLKHIQSYQYERRLYAGYRILAVQLLNGFILKFNNLGIKKLMIKANLYNGLKNLYGTFKRIKNIHANKK